MVKEFKEFVTRGNVIDLAVAVVIGAAFTAVVTSFTTNILDGILAAFGGQPNLDDTLVLTVNDAQIRFGAFLGEVLNFLIIAFVIFLFVKAINRAQRLRAQEEAEGETEEPTELEVLTDIRDLLARNDQPG